MIKVNILDHPLIQHKLTQIRQKDTSTTQFRQIINEIGGLMVYEITRDLPLEQIEIETPVAKTKQMSLQVRRWLLFQSYVRD